MGMWQGIGQGLAAVEERKFNQQQLDIRKRAEERAEEAFEIDKLTTRTALASQIRDLYGSGSSSKTSKGKGNSKSTKITTSENKNNFQILVERFSVDEAEVQKLYATAGASGVAEAVKLATSYSDKFKTGNYTGPEPSIVIGQMLENALYTNSETLEYDWDKITTEIGVPLDDALRTMLGESYTLPGAVSFESPALVEKPGLSDLADVEKRAVSNSLQSAKRENRIIFSRSNELVKIQDTRSLTDIEQQEFDWISGRAIKIDSAINSHKDQVYNPLIELYGSTMTDLLDYYKQFEGAPIGVSFLEATQSEIEVPNRAVALQLLQSQILLPGMVVRNLETGRIIPIGD